MDLQETKKSLVALLKQHRSDLLRQDWFSYETKKAQESRGRAIILAWDLVEEVEKLQDQLSALRIECIKYD